MGKYNSSTYRVSPMVEYIRDNLERLNKLMSWFGVKVNSLPNCYRYGDDEKLLKPSKEHLIKIVKYLSETNGIKLPRMNKNREILLYGKDEERDAQKEKAIKLIEKNYNTLSERSRSWYIFEGYTHPDLFVEGKDYILIGEGKWTEPHITTNTSNLTCRNQMVRHIQAALNYSNKKIYAFYLVDKNCGYLDDLTPDALKKQLKQETIQLSNREQERIAESFIGYITWQNIKEIFPEIKFMSKEEIDLL